MPMLSRWDRMAFGGLQDELSHVLRRLTAAATQGGVDGSDPARACDSVAHWLDRNVHGLGRYRELIGELSSSGEASLPVLSVITRAFSDLGRAV
jgi:NAD-specific glutamate dehydrogenase